ncbi:MAG: TetR/AcrR family transcriptional regulator [Anaerolineae bacterium]|jgi:AcrR family transcriptional regulator
MPNEQTLSRRERRAAARRDQILDGAARVFADKGFARATTREIARAADVSEGTIYNYFESKKDLLIGLMNRLGEAQLTQMQFRADQLEDALELDLRDFLREVYRTRHAFVASHAPILRSIIAEMLVNQAFAEQYYERALLPNAEVLAQHFQGRVERGEMRNLDIQLLLRFFSVLNAGLLLGLLIGDEVIEARWQSEAFTTAVADFVLYGLGAGRKPDEGS